MCGRSFIAPALNLDLTLSGLSAMHDRRQYESQQYQPMLLLLSKLVDSFVTLVEGVGIALQVLSNGVECRLQRNALAVLEPPTGNETVSLELSVHICV